MRVFAMRSLLTSSHRLPRVGACLLLLLLVCAPAVAQEPSLYEGETPVSGQGAGAREAALPRALGQALIRLTGDPAIGSDPAIAPALAQAPQLLQQYRYRQLDGGGLALIASFRPAGVDALLAEAGRLAWLPPRPEPVVWLAIDDGRGPRLVGSSQAGAVAPLTERAAQRGLRFNFPLLDLEDQRTIDAGRVWQFDLGAATQATARYPSQAALLGRLQRQGGGWAVEWRVLDNGEQIAETRLTDADARVLLAAGADLAADALARRYASQLVDSGPPGTYRIVVEAVRDAEDYARLMGYLRGLPLVRASTPLAAQADQLELSLDLGTGIDGFARLVERAGVLQPQPANADEVRRFRLQP